MSYIVSARPSAMPVSQDSPGIESLGLDSIFSGSVVSKE